MLSEFIDACSHFQLSDPKVAKEALYLLRSHARITPPILIRTAGMLGWPRTIESAKMFANWMKADGWIHYSHKPYAGRGTAAVPAYEPTEKWKAFLAAHSK